MRLTIVLSLHKKYVYSYNSAIHIFYAKGECKIMAIAANLRLQRKKAGLTQIELADKLGVSIATLRRWESGETAPTGTRIIELANMLKISPDEIVKDGDVSGPAKTSLLFPHHEASGGMLVYEGEGTRIELPPTEKGYEIFQKLIENMMNRRKEQTNPQN